MTKVCPRCKQLLDESKYNWKIKGKQLAAYCKICSRAYIKSHYNRNTEYYIKKATKRNLTIRNILQNCVGNYLQCHPCVDCGEKDITVLEFDHKDPKKKMMEISLLLRSMRSVEIVMSEIEKCEVRCANCHRRKTARETKSWKLLFAPVA